MSSSDRPDVSMTAATGAEASVVRGAGASGPDSEERVSTPAGLAYVGALSFLASRAAPSGAFVIALAGGVALARAGERHGARRGYGASIAAMIQTVAYLGPARFNGPLTQAITAPMMGALQRRGVGRLGQFLACAGGRILHNTLASTFFILVIIGLDAYAGTYDRVFGDLPVVPSGPGAAVAFTGLGIVAWAAVASAVQVHVYRRGLRRWQPAPPGPSLGAAGEAREEEPAPRRFDPRAVALAATVAFALLLASTEWSLLIAVAVWLAAAWALSRPDRDAVPAGLVLTLLLGGSSLVFSLVGGLGLETGLRRGARAALLVLVATWLRAAAGSTGIREVARRSLGRLRRIPSVPEASAILDELGTGGRLAPSGRALLGQLRQARKRPLPMVDAVLGWVAGESDRFRASLVEPPTRLRLLPRDGVLVLATAATGLALLLV